MVFDDTGDTPLTLWDDTVLSSSRWTPSETILLLTSPHYDPSKNRKQLSVSTKTFVEVDPAMYDTEWLRDYAKKLSKKENCNPSYPDEGERPQCVKALLLKR